MITEIQYTSIKRVLDDLMDHPMLRDLTLEQAVRHTLRFISLNGFPALYTDKTAEVGIEDFRGVMPCDLISIVQVRDMRTGIAMRAMTDTFYPPERRRRPGCCVDLTHNMVPGHRHWNEERRQDMPPHEGFPHEDFHHGEHDIPHDRRPHDEEHGHGEPLHEGHPRHHDMPHHDELPLEPLHKRHLHTYSYMRLREESFKTQGRIIYTSFPHGRIEMVYKSIPVDDDGYPLLIDNETYLAALEAYIKKQVFTVKYDLGKISAAVLQNAQQEYAWQAGMLDAEINIPSMSEMEAITRMWNTMIPQVRHFDTTFREQGSREYIRNHRQL